MLLELKKSVTFLVLCFTFFSDTTRAEDELVIAVGLAKPPYVIQSDNSGFELDLIRQIVKKMGKSTQFIYTQYGHSSKMLEVKEVDAVMTTNKSVFADMTKLSDEYITYQNVAISLKKNNLIINSNEDLANYTIASFQKADKVLGQSFASAVDKSPLYMKIADQSQQPMLLLKNRVEVLIMDINIFMYFTRQLGVNDTNTLFTYHAIFPKTNYRIAFKNKDNVKVFNEALAQFKQTDEYLQLKQNYNL
jgi:polar amino acid transport system substrate-binding protein